jgi:hypothetical protein
MIRLAARPLRRHFYDGRHRPVRIRRDARGDACRCAQDSSGHPEACGRIRLTLTKRAMLSRGAAVIRTRTLIVNLPGSQKPSGSAFRISSAPVSRDCHSARRHGDCAR